MTVVDDENLDDPDPGSLCPNNGPGAGTPPFDGGDGEDEERLAERWTATVALDMRDLAAKASFFLDRVEAAVPVTGLAIGDRRDRALLRSIVADIRAFALTSRADGR